MKARKIVDNVYWMGAIDWNRRLFDSLVPLPDGTSYNAYLVKGSEKTALLDTVDPTMVDVLMEQLKDVSQLDYVVAHHAEQDHSGALPEVLQKYPNAKIVTNAKARDMLIDLLLLPEDRFQVVGDGEVLSLGDLHLQFILTPWVHWPETMSTYLPERKILFTCDFFGSHLATSDLYAVDQARVYEAAKLYYAEIMMPYAKQITKDLDKISGLDVDIIAPSHGPIYDNPQFIVDAYREWVHGAPKNYVVIPYVSMHGSVDKMVSHLVAALAERGVRVQQYELTVTDIGKLAMSLVDAATIIFATPTVLAGPHPLVAYAGVLTNALRPKAKFAGVIGSYGWSGRPIEQVSSLIPSLKVETFEPVLCKGHPRQEHFEALDRLADAIAAKHQELGLE
ncbi:MAG: FprA family A-type flavoprotein [Calditrichaeota bacterium]|nr:FprA family A-type flavoprotein [Calditrichota bacterium]